MTAVPSPLLAACALALVLPGPASTSPAPPAAPDPGAWVAIGRAESHLRRDEPEKARREGRWALFHAAGGGDPELLAAAERVLAVAAMGLGQPAEALWRWHVAVALQAGAAAASASSLGDAGRLLELALDGERRALEANAGLATGPARQFLPPRVRRRRAVLLPGPQSSPGAAARGPVMVRVLVDTDGRPRAPEVLFARVPAPHLRAVLEALAGWRFEPARLDGTPVPFPAIVEVRF